MTGYDSLQVILYLIIIILCVKPLGWYIAQVYEGKSFGLNKFLNPVENLIYKLCGIDPTTEMDWKNYVYALLFLNLLSILLLYGILRLQHYLPFNPQLFAGLQPDVAFNAAISFVTNTDWQAYSGEKSVSYLSQMCGFTVQNFISAATGMSVLMALIRGLTRREAQTLGNYWVDLVRGILYILLPLAIIFSIVLTSLGVIQNLNPYQTTTLLQPSIAATTATLPMGPVASQVAIKQIGTNGGGFFNTNSAHPFENPTPLTNFLEMLAILLIPAALCYTFGYLVKDTRQGWAIFIAMFIIFIPLLICNIYAEQHGNPRLLNMGIETSHRGNIQNYEGKETRFGITNSALWTSASTASSNGSLNSSLDSYTPMGGLVPLVFLNLGEVIFGGVGSGMYSMLLLIIFSVFVAGLMVGRTAEYLGKKIETFEIQMASIAVLLLPLQILISTAIATVNPHGIAGITNLGIHGFTEIFYAFSSMANNNGSAFNGLGLNVFYNLLGGIVMLLGRFWIIIPVLAIAGSLVQKKITPASVGVLPTHTLQFISLLIGIIVISSALTFFPALALGPIVEHLILRGF